MPDKTPPAGLRCRFCGAPAVARYRVDRGCACYPDDREQDLCAQHIVGASPLGGMELIADYTVEQVVTKGVWP